MGDDPELENIERRLRRSDHLRRRAEDDLAEYQRRLERERVEGMTRAQRKRWMLGRMRDLGLVALILTVLRRVRSHPGEAAATSAMAAMVGVLAMGPSESPGDGPGRAATPPTAAAPPSPSGEVGPEYEDVQVEIVESVPTSGRTSAPTVQPDEATADPVPVDDPAESVVAEPELSGAVDPDPTEAPEPEPSPTEPEPSPSPTPSPTTPPGDSERDRRKICLELDARPVVDLGACVRELLGLSGDTQP